MTRLASLLALLVLAAPAARADDRILGTWELVGLAPVSGDAASPRGQANVKERYAPDGTLSLVRPDGTLASPDTVTLDYAVDGARLTLDAGDGRTRSASVAFAGPDEMVVRPERGAERLYRRMEGPDAIDRQLEPKSLLVLARAASELGSPPVVPTPGPPDRPDAPAGHRVIGVWEVVEHRDARRTAVPPFGFMNDVWTFDGTRVSLRLRGPSGDVEPGPMPYAVTDDELAVGAPGRGFALALAFDEWGRLLLDAGDGTGTTVLRLVARDADAAPAIPPRVTLLGLAGER